MYIKYLSAFIFLLAAIVTKGQTNSPAKSSAPTPFTYVEQMPIAGYNYQEYLAKNIQYPHDARMKGIGGKVVIKFIVAEDGSITDCHVVKSVDSELDAEALRVVQSFPKWRPGKQNGKYVKVYFTLPIVFNLGNDDAEPKRVFSYVEEMPAPGYDLLDYLAKNIHYPEKARKEGVEGRVVVQFVVNDDGTLSDFKVIKGLGFGCDEEALRVLQSMPPHWKPGRQGGKPVSVSFNQPIVFKL